jgi:hypothetical protein
VGLVPGAHIGQAPAHRPGLPQVAPVTQITRICTPRSARPNGGARAVDPFQLCDWQGLLTILATAGPGELIRQVRAVEAADPAGIRWPRNKIHDDATAILIQQ